MDLYKEFLESSGVCTDTRKITGNCLFFALKGENFNGNDFASRALEAGARLAIVDDPGVVADNRYILVKDVLKELQDLARKHRRTSAIKVLAIAGSNGKTTTKELIYRVLSKGFSTFATPGNLNNHIGVPLSLLSIKEEKYAVIELGANHQGENAFLCSICEPDFVLVTNSGKDHLEGFGGIQGVIASNKEVYDYIRGRGIAFINADDEGLLNISEGCERVFYGVNSHQGTQVSISERFPFLKVKSGDIDIPSRLFGDFQAYNIAAALAVGKFFGISISDIGESIGSYQPQNNRSQLIEWEGNKVLLDAYNANPSSMEGMLDSFSALGGIKKMAILGDMFELGDASEEEHKNIANKALNSDLDMIILVGKEFAKAGINTSALLFDNYAEVKEYLKTHPVREHFILVKGSRGMTLEKIFQ